MINSLYGFFNFLREGYDAIVNPNRKGAIQTTSQFLSAHFDPDRCDHKPINNHKFALVMFVKSEPWKTIENRINWLEGVTSSNELKNLINDWKNQIGTIRKKYPSLQDLYKQLKEKQKALSDYIEQPNQNLSFIPLTDPNELIVTTQRQLTEEVIQKSEAVHKAQTELLQLRDNLWKSIFDAKKDCTTLDEEEKYENLIRLLDLKKTHFQVPFEVPDQINSLDESSLVPLCLAPKGQNSPEILIQTARKAIESKLAIKGIVIFKGTPLSVQEKRGFTVYYEVEKCNVIPGDATPQLSTTKQSTQVKVKMMNEYLPEIDNISNEALSEYQQISPTEAIKEELLIRV